LTLPDEAEQILSTVLAIVFSLAIAWMAYALVDVVEVVLKKFADRTPSKLDDMLVPMVRASLRVTVVVLTIVQVATIISQKPVTSIIAGLGVGGLAIGLAAQDMIKNFFGSMMIFSDRPFDLGDRIVVDGFDGPVEAVGFRSTRIRTLDGHVVTIPNGELANKAIQNISKRPNIKRAFQIGLTYDTTPDQIQQAIEIVQDVLADHEGMRADMPPRVYFTEFQDSALALQVIYWYHPADYWAYVEFSQRVNLEILSRFNAAGLEFAFPTQTVHLTGSAGASAADANGNE
ncbi:MAG: mechanosensitive ion channel family protein, partial [Candidatus Zixiibacteriota bacterium]